MTALRTLISRAKILLLQRFRRFAPLSLFKLLKSCGSIVIFIDLLRLYQFSAFLLFSIKFICLHEVKCLCDKGMKNNQNKPQHIARLYDKVVQILDQARSTVYKTANFEMVKAYWEIGRAIVEEEQQGKERANYGAHLLKELSVNLTHKYGKGFDDSNLRYIRKFYLIFPKCDALRHELSWTHYRLLLKVDDENARLFYLNEAVKRNWSTRTLERQIGNLYYQRLLMSRDKSIVRKEIEREKHIIEMERRLKE